MTTDYVKKAKPRTNTRKTSTSKTDAGKNSARTNNTRGGKRQSKSRTANSKQNTVTAQKPPYLAIALLVITVAAFGYFLWTINGSADMQNNNLQPPQQVAAPKPQPKTTTVVQQEPDIPEPPKEQWQYMDELKTKEVKVEKAELKKTGPWLLQCATFKEARRAETLKAQLALLGFESRIKPSETRYGLRHRVQLGPYETNRDAQAERHKLSRHKINGCKIWPWK